MPFSKPSAECAWKIPAIDMLAAQTFDQVRLDAIGCSTDYPRGHELYVSMDGTSWGNAVASGSGNGPITDIAFDSQTARYIKVVQTGSSTSWWGISEMNVYDT